MQQRELYELQAGPVDNTATLHKPTDRDTVIAVWLARALTDPAALSIVEVGCGDGELTLTLCHQFPGCSVLGLDIVQSRISTARARATAAGVQNRARFDVIADEDQLANVPSASADLFVAIDVLEHVFDVFGFVQNAARVVRPQGWVLLRVPNIAYVKHRLALLRGTLPVTSSWFGPAYDLKSWRERWGWDGGHLHYFTLAALDALLRDAGLQAVQWRDPGARAERIRRLAPSLLVGNLCVLARRL